MADVTQAEYDRLVRFASFAVGQLQGLNSDHRCFLEFPGIRESLSQSEVRRGRIAGERWLADLWDRYDLPPEYFSGRGSAALTAQLLGDL